MLSEREMEDAIAADPTRYLGEDGLILVARQHHIGNYIFDLLFRDRHGGMLIVEIQRGTLDRNHTYKILDYYDEFKEKNPGQFVELMVVANHIPQERKDRLRARGIEWRELPVADFPQPTQALPSADAQVPLSPAVGAPRDTGTAAASDTSGLSLPGRAPSDERQSFLRFWSAVLSEANRRGDALREFRPRPAQCLNVWGRRGIHVIMCLKKHEAWVEVCIQRPTPESASIYGAFQRYKALIEERFGSSLVWSQAGGRNRCKIMTQRIPLGYADTERWTELHTRLVDLVLCFRRALGQEYDMILQTFG